MLYRLFILVVVCFSFINCEKEELDPYPCVDGMCNSGFWVDRAVQPDAYEDGNGYWHIKHWGPNYFTIKGELDEMHEEYVVNDIPLVETRFDSDYWIWVEEITFTIPLYSPFGAFYDPQFTTPVAIGDTSISMCFMPEIAEPFNIAGYSYSEKVCGDCPYSELIMGTYSKNTYSPQQQFYLDSRMRGDTLNVYMRARYNYDLGESEEQDHIIKIIVD